MCCMSFQVGKASRAQALVKKARGANCLQVIRQSDAQAKGIFKHPQRSES